MTSLRFMPVQPGRVALAGFAAAAIGGSFLGWGTDRDTLRIAHTAQAMWQGHYVRSRSFGFPLHEAASAVAYAAGGLTGANLASALVTLLGIVLALRLVRDLAPARRGAAAVALCGSPMLLTNASAAIDFGWSFAAAMGVLLAARRAAFGWLFAAVVTLLLIRPDNVLFVAAMCLATAGNGRAAARPAVLACASAGLVALGVYVALNGPGVFLTGVSTTRPWGARAARAGVLLAAALGPGGALALGASALARPHDAGRIIVRTALWSWALYLPRFVALPDQMEYLILPVETSILAACLVMTRRAAWAVALLVCLPNLITIAMFRRDATTGALSIRPALAPGALAQDWASRRFAMRMQTDAMTARVASRLGPAAGDTWQYDTFMPGYVSNTHDLAIGAAHLYRVLPVPGGPANLATVPRSLYRNIYACDMALGPGIGWRGLETATSSAVIDDRGVHLRCWLASKAVLS